MDLNKLSTGDKVLGGSGIALFIFGFFPWFGVSGYDGGRNAWDFFFWGIIPVLIGLLLIGYVVATKLADGVNLPDLPVPYPLAVLGLAALAALLVILKLLIGDSVGLGPLGGEIDLDRKAGIFLSALAALGLAAGGFLKFQEEGGELPNKRGGPGTTSSGSTGDGSGGAPTPF
ncbi:MAG: hypothetical protein ACR2LA_08800 [Acidimicrobiales bacterium]